MTGHDGAMGRPARSPGKAVVTIEDVIDVIGLVRSGERRRHRPAGRVPVDQVTTFAEEVVSRVRGA